MNNCEYLTFLKRQRKKHWGKRAEKPRWRLMGKLLRQKYIYQNRIKLFKEIDKLLKTTAGEKLNKALSEITVTKSDRLIDVVKKLNKELEKTGEKIGVRINEQLRNL